MVFGKLRKLVCRDAKSAEEKNKEVHLPEQSTSKVVEVVENENITHQEESESQSEPENQDFAVKNVSKKRKYVEVENDNEINKGDMMSIMMNYFDKRFDTIQNNIIGQGEMESKKRKVDKYTFKQKGNEIQFNFNDEILDLVELATRNFNSSNHDTTAKLLHEITSKMQKRNKIIKIADRSPAGWDIAKEYEADPMASDSDDEKKIRSAESRALTKRKARINKSYVPPLRRRNDHQFRNVQRYEFPPNNNNNRPPFQPPWTWSPRHSTPAFISTRNVKPTDTCFGCGEKGHWKPHCPKSKGRPEN